ncbi:lanthionine synthetase LanC family protein [Streptomyces sp. NPDC007083]|uniref:class III lanthionine synthetase LanKC N-terminal domain-containing protein n=1 Tax=Streptomyces sp. NPDC007083 TaxID=3156913 RepID=UPI0033C49FFE
MADWNAEDVLRRLIADRRAPHSLSTGATWTRVRCEPAPDLPEHGWKLHISSRVDGLPQLAAALFPHLLSEGCGFKVARSDRVLRRLNDAGVGSGAVGKAVTVYPRPERVRGLGRELAELLRGHPGPRVPSDRRVAEDAPVYYRYGPFRTHWRSGPYGTLVVVIHGPDGQEFEAAASLGYRQPPWVSDPFRTDEPPPGNEVAPTDTAAHPAPDDHAPRPAADVLLGGRYRAVEGVYESARGNVYRAVETAGRAGDAAHARTVIVKTARAHVSEDRDGNDVRVRLRNERRVLTACAGVPGIPAFLDHFAHAADEYLVTSDVGDRNLMEHIWRNGALLPAPCPPASMPAADDGEDPGATGEAGATWPADEADAFTRLARELATTLGALHAKGVVMRDVTPRNIVLDDTGRAHLIDFGISALDGIHLPGGTPGYAPREQLDRTQEPSAADDHYALGMVLVFAATGLPPVTGEASTALARTRALQCLHAVHGTRRPELRAVVGDLLSRDPDRSAGALADLASGDWRARTGGHALPPPAAPTGQVADLADRVLEILLAEAGEYHLGGEGVDFPAVDASLYTGSAGVGLELLHHRHRPGVPELLRRLARHAHRSLATVPTADGLFSGRTGTEVFLAAARRAGVEVPTGPVLPAATRGRAPDATDAAEVPEVLRAVDIDVVSGHAGVGLGRLLLADLGDPGAPAAAAALAEPLLRREDPAVPSAHLAGELGRETTFGYAHGYLGVTDFLLLLAARNGDRGLLEAGRLRAHRLAALVPDLVAAAGAPTASQMAVSWCRGLGGLARVLRHAWLVLDEPELRRAAETATRGCLPWLTRLSTLGQCCGTAGLGAVLLDLAVDTGDDRYLDAAHEAARHLMRRSHGPDDAPALMANTHTRDAPYSWAQGYAGILAFLRRLREPAGPDLLPEPTGAPARHGRTVGG